LTFQSFQGHILSQLQTWMPALSNQTNLIISTKFIRSLLNQIVEQINLTIWLLIVIKYFKFLGRLAIFEVQTSRKFKHMMSIKGYQRSPHWKMPTVTEWAFAGWCQEWITSGMFAELELFPCWLPYTGRF
jgi:hypothetical protein